jgi:hypothetical protein
LFKSIGIFFSAGIVAFGCGNSGWQNYDKGYEAAWEGEEEPSSFWTSKEEKEGYEQGLNDVWTYDMGYGDGYDEKRPKYFNNPFYVDGYKDGKEDKGR